MNLSHLEYYTEAAADKLSSKFTEIKEDLRAERLCAVEMEKQLAVANAALRLFEGGEGAGAILRLEGLEEALEAEKISNAELGKKLAMTEASKAASLAEAEAELNSAKKRIDQLEVENAQLREDLKAEGDIAALMTENKELQEKVWKSDASSQLAVEKLEKVTEERILKDGELEEAHEDKMYADNELKYVSQDASLHRITQVMNEWTRGGMISAVRLWTSKMHTSIQSSLEKALA